MYDPRGRERQLQFQLVRHTGRTIAVHAFDSWNLGITEPQFLSLGPAFPDFKTLRTCSPLVEAGLDLGFDFAGTAPDIGALQRQQRAPRRLASDLVIGSGGTTTWEH